jgi:hypothetical protein
MFPFVTMTRPAQRAIHFLSSGCRRLFPGVKCSERESKHSFPCSTACEKPYLQLWDLRFYGGGKLCCYLPGYPDDGSSSLCSSETSTWCHNPEGPICIFHYFFYTLMHLSTVFLPESLSPLMPKPTIGYRPVLMQSSSDSHSLLH